MTEQPLTKRHIDVLQLAADGLTGKQTALRLGLRPHTIKAYILAARDRLDAKTVAHAVALALRAGLIE